jgi:hypothetical protein
MEKYKGVIMEEYKLNFKWPKWLFLFCVIGYSIWSILTVLYTIFLLINIKEVLVLPMFEKTICFAGFVVHIFFQIFGWYVIVMSTVQQKYYYIINKDGVYNNQVNLLKKNLLWKDELYYCITNSFVGLYKSKMLPFEGKIINEQNIKNGYISIKSKKALKKWYDNKGWIVMSTKLIKGNIQVDDIVDMINKSRETEL